MHITIGGASLTREPRLALVPTRYSRALLRIVPIRSTKRYGQLSGRPAIPMAAHVVGSDADLTQFRVRRRHPMPPCDTPEKQPMLTKDLIRPGAAVLLHVHEPNDRDDQQHVIVRVDGRRVELQRRLSMSTQGQAKRWINVGAPFPVDVDEIAAVQAIEADEPAQRVEPEEPAIPSVASPSAPRLRSS